MYIYKITNKKNGLFYIGQTIQKPEKRWNQHINFSKRRVYKNHPFYSSLLKNGADSFDFVVLFKCETIEELNKKEEFLVKENLFPNGYNLKEGGFNKKYTKESKEKISKSKKGSVVSLEVRKKISKSVIMQNIDNPDLREIRVSALNRVHKDSKYKKIWSEKSKEMWQCSVFRNKMSKIKKGVKKTTDHKNKISAGILNFYKKPFTVYKIKEGFFEIVGDWNNITTCCKDLNLLNCKVSEVLNSNRRSHKGYFFKYKIGEF